MHLFKKIAEKIFKNPLDEIKATYLLYFIEINEANSRDIILNKIGKFNHYEAEIKKRFNINSKEFFPMRVISCKIELINNIISSPKELLQSLQNSEVLFKKERNNEVNSLTKKGINEAISLLLLNSTICSLYYMVTNYLSEHEKSEMFLTQQENLNILSQNKLYNAETSLLNGIHWFLRDNEENSNHYLKIHKTLKNNVIDYLGKWFYMEMPKELINKITENHSNIVEDKPRLKI